MIALESSDGTASLAIEIDASAPAADRPLVHARVTLEIDGDLTASVGREVWFELVTLQAFADGIEAGDEALLESVGAGELRLAAGRDGEARVTMHHGACAVSAKVACGDRKALASSVRRVITQ